MKATECDARGKDRRHCWHQTGKQLLGNPPTHEQMCCFCGETRYREPWLLRSDKLGHGDFYNDTLVGADSALSLSATDKGVFVKVLSDAPTTPEDDTALYDYNTIVSIKGGNEI